MKWLSEFVDVLLSPTWSANLVQVVIPLIAAFVIFRAQLAHDRRLQSSATRSTAARAVGELLILTGRTKPALGDEGAVDSLEAQFERVIGSADPVSDWQLGIVAEWFVRERVQLCRAVNRRYHQDATRRKFEVPGVKLRSRRDLHAFYETLQSAVLETNDASLTTIGSRFVNWDGYGNPPTFDEREPDMVRGIKAELQLDDAVDEAVRIYKLGRDRRSRRGE